MTHTRRRLGLVFIAVLLVLSGCTAYPPVQSPGAVDVRDGFSDPSEDVLGWEGGYWYDEDIDVNQSDGLNESEREAFVARTMARVERIRGLEFEESVPVDVVSRAEYREDRSSGNDSNADYNAWNNQVWEALLLVGEDRDISAVFSELYGGAVQGYYSLEQDEIVVVSDAEQPSIDRVTLAHELVHALQDQHFGFGGGRTQDAQLAARGLTEGDASLVEQLYEDRCSTEWDCVARPERSGGGGGGDIDLGVFYTIYVPYSDGPTFVDHLRESGGWDAVDAAYDDFPATTEQIIHPEKYPDEGAVDVRVSDRSSSAWSRFDLEPEADSVGEASVFVLFYEHGLVSDEQFYENGEYSPYRYVSPASAGWAGDSVVPYRNADGENAYVWKTAWDSKRDARQFADAYRTVLVERLDARVVEKGRVYRVPDSSPFGDAFRVVVDGDTVTVVNAPTVSKLDDVHEA